MSELRAQTPSSHTWVKLPNIHVLVTPHFWDFYQLAVHNNEQLSEIEKSNSLLGYSARKAIYGFVLTLANCHKALSIKRKIWWKAANS